MRNWVLPGVMGLLLTGCAADHVPMPLSAAEKQDIKSGRIIKLTDVNPPKGNLVLEKGKLGNGVVVCATAFDFPTPNCYPQLSQLVSRSLSERGIPVAKDQGSADAVLYFNAAFWFEGHQPNRDFSWALEQWLQQGKNDFGAVDGSGSNGSREASALLMGKALQLSGAAVLTNLVSSGGGSYHDRHWISISLAKVDMKSAVLLQKKIGPIRFNEAPSLWGKTYEDVQRYEFSGRYVGPANITNSSLPLFEQAIKETLDRVVINM